MNRIKLVELLKKTFSPWKCEINSAKADTVSFDARKTQLVPIHYKISTMTVRAVRNKVQLLSVEQKGRFAIVKEFAVMSVEDCAMKNNAKNQTSADLYLFYECYPCKNC